MDFVFNETPAYKSGSNTDQFDLLAGQSLKIETSPNGEEILNIEVPVGKKWTVIISAFIREEDE